MTNVPGLYATGESNFSDHGANRLGASALMQGLADGYFVLPYTIGNYLSAEKYEKTSTDHEAFKTAEATVKSMIDKLLSIKGSKSVDHYHKELGLIMWEYCGMSRDAEGLNKAKNLIKDLKADFWKNVKVLGTNEEFNSSLEKASRVADFLELGELMIVDALHREESCGGHFREEYQTEEGEAKRNDEDFAYVAAWEFAGENKEEILNKEQLIFENVKLTQRSYK
jgi:succinate dehydrogenase / fumarate reductase flavoprotein subunit